MRYKYNKGTFGSEGVKGMESREGLGGNRKENPLTCRVIWRHFIFTSFPGYFSSIAPQKILHHEHHSFPAAAPLVLLPLFLCLQASPPYTPHCTPSPTAAASPIRRLPHPLHSHAPFLSHLLLNAIGFRRPR